MSMKKSLFYCAFYGSDTTGVAGQQNLSRPVRDELERFYDVTDISSNPTTVKAFPSVWAVVFALHRLLWVRTWSGDSENVTVVDMIHSLTVLPNLRSADRLIVLGHDSYALRTKRDRAAAKKFSGRMKLTLSWIAWRYAELLLRRLAWRCVFVSPIDHSYAMNSKAQGVIAIPVKASLNAKGTMARKDILPRLPGPPRLLVSLPVLNPAQNAIDRSFVESVLTISKGRTRVTLWGKGAQILDTTASEVTVVNWVEDYATFLSSFDLLIYPRMIGSGFHGKLAEALVLGVPVYCADWVAEPLRTAGYDGITSFSSQVEFSEQLAMHINTLVAMSTSTKTSLSVPTLPASAKPETALAPLIHQCEEAFITHPGRIDDP